jgi:hypothetical protein
MAATVNAATGDPSANSYVTLSDANSYFDTRLHGAVWTSASDDNKNRALIWATRLIDATVRFTGQKTNPSQALEWPRTGMFDRDETAISASTIPDLLKVITCEVALTLLSSDRLQESEAAVAGLSSLRAGPVTLNFKDAIPAPAAVSEGIYRMFIFSWIWRVIPGPLVV